MNTLLSKKKLFLSLLFFETVIIGFLFIVPLEKVVRQYVQLYSQAFVEPFPEMKIEDGHIKFLDSVPVKLTIGDSVQIICDTLYNEDYFTGSAKNSVFITEKIIYFKTLDGIKQYNITSANLSSDDKIIVPEEIKSFLNKYALTILRVLTVVLFLLLFIVFLMINTLGAGIGFMVDAFESGKFNFIQLSNLAGIFFTLMLVLNYALFRMNVLTLKLLSVNVVIFCLVIALFVYYLSKRSRFSI